MQQKIYPIVYPNPLRKYRKAAGLRQHEVACALGLSSIERISKWENGHSIPKGRSLYQLAVLYGVPPQQLFSEIYQSPPVAEKIPTTKEVTVVPSRYKDGTGPFWKEGPIRLVTPISSSTSVAASEVGIPEEA
jgi:transcriptional regulator with XRE-family HTH domain